MNARAAISAHGPDVVAPPPLIYLGGLVGGLVLDRVLSLPRLPAAVRFLGVPAVAGGVGLVAWFVATMRGAGTPLDPRQAPTALVEQGPFALTRNPGYLGMALIYSGTTLLAGGRWPLLFLPGVLMAIDRGVVAREEDYLQKRFGASYAKYRSRVKRWF
jgi:protein-S-isoprenylcysteine O-methyltransferase Ste14